MRRSAAKPLMRKVQRLSCKGVGVIRRSPEAPGHPMGGRYSLICMATCSGLRKDNIVSRQFYTDDAGFALSSKIDTDLHADSENFQAGTTSDLSFDTGVIGSDGTTLYTDGADNAAALADAGIRRAIRELDDSDVPQSSRALVIPPIEKENLLGLARFTEQAFVGEVGAGNSIRNGRVGSVYGVDVYVSTNCATTKTNSNRVCVLLHKSALALAMQVGIRVQTQYKQEYLATLLTADVLFGVKTIRDDAGVAIIVPGS